MRDWLIFYFPFTSQGKRLSHPIDIKRPKEACPCVMQHVAHFKLPLLLHKLHITDKRGQDPFFSELKPITPHFIREEIEVINYTVLASLDFSDTLTEIVILIFFIMHWLHTLLL